MTRELPRRCTRSNAENDSNDATSQASSESNTTASNAASTSEVLVTATTSGAPARASTTTIGNANTPARDFSVAAPAPSPAGATKNLPAMEASTIASSAIGATKVTSVREPTNTAPNVTVAPNVVPAREPSNAAPTGTGTVKKVPTSTASGVPKGSSTIKSRPENDLLAMERRIALLERMLKERDTQFEMVKVALQGNGDNGSSAATIHSDVAAQPSPTLPSTQPQSTQPVTVHTDAGPTVAEARYLPPVSTATVYNSANMPSDAFSITSTPHYMNAASTAPVEPISNRSSHVPFQSASAYTGYGNMQFLPHDSRVLSKIIDLPEFGGKAEDWPIFHAAFVESTAAYGYTNFENNQRLRKCLKGEAREVVKSLLIHPSNVSCIIDQLQFRFGRPEQLIRSQLAQVREIAPISENAIGKLIPFATKVKNICAFLQSANGEYQLSNPTLLDELIGKLPVSKRIEWGTFASTIKPRATVVHFSEWISSLANVICIVYDEEHGRDSKRRVVLHVDKKQHTRRCPICQGAHTAIECKRFIESTVADRWKEAKSRRLCFACLQAGYSTRDCHRRKPCSINGCPRMHNKLLHEVSGSMNNSQSEPAPSSNGGEALSQRAARQQHSSSHTPAQQVPQHQHSSSDTEAAVLSFSANAFEGKLLFRILPVTLYGKHKSIDTYAAG
ncbi:uncharacterized protein LOC118757004 [Rhagoletis pomonella]|uniref:uncharacterized protein LOC118757004 n=1 Tax=Rhagoletis pomonella TaxID=28610 RepID=UPI0017837F0B|nr:uncharacterized protein LOC118757004 [Rhagoletis pomonella]